MEHLIKIQVVVFITFYLLFSVQNLKHILYNITRITASEEDKGRSPSLCVEQSQLIDQMNKIKCTLQ
jgi:hypothetical protein